MAKRMSLEFDDQQDRQERRRQPTAILDHDEALLAIAVGRGHEAAEEAQQRVLGGVDHVVVALRPHPIARIEEQEPEDVDRPMEGFDDGRAEADEDGPEDDGAQDPVEEHAMLVHQRHGEGREDQREDEDVVNRQAELEQIAGEVRRAVLRASRQRDQYPERQAQGDVEGAEHRRLAEGRRVSAAVEDEQVEGQDRADGDGEDDPQDRVDVQTMSLRAYGTSRRRSPPTAPSWRGRCRRGHAPVARDDAGHPGPGVLPLGCGRC